MSNKILIYGDIFRAISSTSNTYKTEVSENPGKQNVICSSSDNKKAIAWSGHASCILSSH